MSASRKRAKVTVNPASPNEIRRAVKVTASDVRAAKRVISQLGLDKAVRGVIKVRSPARGASSSASSSRRRSL